MRTASRTLAAAACALFLSISPAPADEQTDGVKAFFAADIPGALKHWDAWLKEHPEDSPHHWQRGLALYYAEKYKEGREQFEQHQKVNPRDVENAAWHFLCVAKLESVDAARKAFIPITGDSRVPMKEIHALFAGKGTEEAVLKAAEAEDAATPGGRNARCYAHLYLGLYHEALGNTEKAKTHMTASAFTWKMDHYMGKTAQVHCTLRGWKKE